MNKGFIYTKDNAYGSKICRGCCARDGICRGTDNFYGCTTFWNGIRSEMRKREKHPAIYLHVDGKRDVLFIKEKFI